MQERLGLDPLNKSQASQKECLVPTRILCQIRIQCQLILRNGIEIVLILPPLITIWHHRLEVVDQSILIHSVTEVRIFWAQLQ